MRVVGGVCLALALATGAAAQGTVSIAGYASIQAAIDANPGRMILVPDGEHVINEALRITADGTGLYGFGRIVQSNPAESILVVDGARNVRIRDLTLTRTFPAREVSGWEEAIEGSQAPGVDATGCDGLEIEGVRVLGNKSASASIRLEDCRHSRVRHCVVTDYKRLAIDDRTASEQYGYAFRVIDGSGIVASRCKDLAIEGNRVVEEALLPSPELKARHDLGRLTEGKNPTRKGPLAPPGDYANNWHQGSAIVVTGPEDSDFIRVTGNYIEHAAQGIDLHADHVLCSGNLVNGAFIGVKCMHGSRNAIISNNTLSRIDLWGICMQPGTASHGVEPAAEGESARSANLTAGVLLANNVFSHFGRGLDAFNWQDAGITAISLQWGPLEENPPMTDVLVTGNIVYDTERETGGDPKYKVAVGLDQRLDRARFHFVGNVFAPGTEGVSNVPLEP